MTDNRNRTVAEIRNAFSKGGGNLAENGTVAWQFALKGVVSIEAAGVDEEAVQLAAIEAGAEDVAADDDVVEVTTQPSDLEPVREALEAAGFAIARAEVVQMPQNLVGLDEKAAIAALKLLERLDDLDDVQRVFSNADFPADLVEAASA
jgi:YebC/PmpR family DNA-binding regulatory protein